MANTDIVNGFIPIGTLGGDPYNGCVRKYYVDATNTVAALGVGCQVALVANTASVIVPEIAMCAAAAVPCGSVMSIAFSASDFGRVYLPASTSSYLFIADSPHLIMAVQSSGTFEDGDIGANGDLTDAGTSTTTGASGQEINQSTITTTDTLIYRIRRLLDKEDNALGANALIEVSYNLHAWSVAGCLSEGNDTGVHN